MKIENFLKPNYLTKKKFPKQMKLILMDFAKKAHEIDKSKPISFYYELFLKRVNKQYTTEKEVSDFFGDQPIET